MGKDGQNLESKDKGRRLIQARTQVWREATQQETKVIPSGSKGTNKTKEISKPFRLEKNLDK